MCGITGFLNLCGKPAEQPLLERMTARLAHRGPDGAGYFCFGPLALGHRRLAVIDLSERGAQPIFSPDKKYVIVYNGEVYNYRELRKQLEEKGYRFFSDTDTEVVLAAYVVWGENGVLHLNGHFSYAIWDGEKQELYLARDRYGVKPLSYYECGDLFAFASEEKALLGHEGIGCQLDREALLEYFTFQNIFTDKTFFSGIKKFPAGNFAVIGSRTGGRLRFSQYWDYYFQEPQQSAGDREYEEEFLRLFEQAVKRQMVSDVEVGSYLSGGIDSGSISAIASRNNPHFKTFTCGFDRSSASGLEAACDERELAEYMSYVFGTEHYEVVLKAGDMERCMRSVVWHLDTPRVGQSYPNYYSSKLASRFVKVVLSGTGGDELFGGYPWRYYRAVRNENFEHYIDQYYAYWQRLIPNRSIHEVFVPIWDEVKHVRTRDIFRDVFKKQDCPLACPEDYVNHSLYFEAKTFLGGLLEVEDKLHMAHGTEVRLPFLDNDLVDFAMRLPMRLKLGNLGEVARLNENDPGSKTQKYFEKTHDGKLLVRKAMGQLLPPSISNGEKKGFSGPDANWFKGESIEFVRQELCTSSAAIYQYLDYGAVKKLIDEHLEGKQNRRLLIWSLLNVEHWLRIFPSG